MATYRPIQISYWQDKFVLKLTPEQKYFYLYLLTNTKTKQCGIYELPSNVICFETGYNEDTVNKLIKFFIENKKLSYDPETEEIFILNWIKFNQVDNKNICSCVVKEIKEVKSKSLIKQFVEILASSNNKKEFTDEILLTINGLTRGLQGATKEETETEEEIKIKSNQKTEKEKKDGFFKKEDQKLIPNQKPILVNTNIGDLEFNKFWKFYNRREGDIMKVREVFKENISSEREYKDLITATRNYNNLTSNRELQYMKLPINFLTCYKDFIRIDN